MASRLLMLSLLAFAVGCTPSSSPESGSTTAVQSLGAETPIPVTTVSHHAGETLTVHVPDMHCPFVCYPRVKETVAKQPGVASVELVEQKEEAAIDNPRLIVTLNGDFNAKAMKQAISEAGFEVAEITPHE